MTALVWLAILVPLLGAIGIGITAIEPRTIAPLAAGAAAAAWVVVAAADTPVAIGSITIDPVLACAAAGFGLVVAADSPPSRLPNAGMLAAMSLVVLAAGADSDGSNGRLFAGAFAVVAVLGSVRLVAVSAPRLAAAVAVLGTALVTAGLVVTGSTTAATLCIVGAGVLLAGSASLPRCGVLVVPAALLAVARVVAEIDPDDAERVALAGAAAGAFVVVAIAAFRVSAADGENANADRGDPAAVAVLAAAVVLFAQDLPGAPTAALLLSAGGLLALLSRHRVGVVAALPGIVATVDVLAWGTQPRHAAAGVVIAGLALAVLTRSRIGERTRKPVEQATLAAAVVFGVIPTWGWAGADLAVYAESLAVAIAAIAVGVGLRSIPLPRPAASPGSAAGTVSRRRRTERRASNDAETDTTTLEASGGQTVSGS